MERKTIVISAVNIRKGGTLTILRDCLSYAATLTSEYRVVALVHDRKLCEYDGIEYIEMPGTIKGWGRRLWAEYMAMNGISKRLGDVYLWLSLHDTTPRVQAQRQAVYCQTSFPFLKTKAQDWKFDPKVALFSMFTKFAYKVYVHRNRYLIVQTNWLREGLSKMLNFPQDQIIVARPQQANNEFVAKEANTILPTFIFPATPDCHKNFETLCEAARQLEAEIGKGKFKVVLTITGTENKYSRWLHEKWGSVESIDFHGFFKRDELFKAYSEAAALVFPSRVETWGLPISEFAPTGKPMLLADLPYSHETAAGCGNVAFFDPESASDLKEKMSAVLFKCEAANEQCEAQSLFAAVPSVDAQVPKADNWQELFTLLLS